MISLAALCTVGALFAAPAEPGLKGHSLLTHDGRRLVSVAAPDVVREKEQSRLGKGR